MDKTATVEEIEQALELFRMVNPSGQALLLELLKLLVQSQQRECGSQE